MVLEFFRRFSGEKPSPPQEKPERILPSDVRYALRYREAKLGREDIKTLAQNGFENEALYLFLKAAAEQPAVQLEAMRELTKSATTAHAEGDDASMKEKIRELVVRGVNNLRPEATVQGDKLAQLSRQGFNYWAQKYQEAAVQYAAESGPTFLVGNATFVGLAPFIARYAAANKPLHVLIPSFIHDDAYDICGYRIEGGTVEPLPKNFARDPHATIIDDTTQTGGTLNGIMKFWTEDGKREQPHFVPLSLTPVGAF